MPAQVSFVVLAQHFHRLRLISRPRSPWYGGSGHVGWPQQPPGAWVFCFAILTWTFWCLRSAHSDFLFLKRRGLETLIKTPLKGIKGLPERQMTLTKELFNDLNSTMRNTPASPPFGLWGPTQSRRMVGHMGEDQEVWRGQK